jgi:hypothetical protein
LPPSSPLPSLSHYVPTPGLPLPPLDESHWRFVFQRDLPEDEDEETEEAE